MVGVLCPDEIVRGGVVDHTYVCGPEPPVVAEVAEPSQRPEQLTLLATLGLASNCGGDVIVTVAVAVHAFASVTVTV
jgi:hypothetical protein